MIQYFRRPEQFGRLSTLLNRKISGMGNIKLVRTDSVVLNNINGEWAGTGVISGLESGKHYVVVAMNGDTNATDANVIGCFVRNDLSLRFNFDKWVTGSARINYMVFLI